MPGQDKVHVMEMPHASPDVRTRDPLYDQLRVFALSTVVLIHVLAAYLGNRSTADSPDIPLIFDHWLHYAVPLFIFISGALVWGRVRDWSRDGYVSFARKRLMAIAVPYVAWATLYYLLRPMANVAPFPRGVSAILTDYVGLLVNGHVWYHLYFVPMIIVFYAFTPMAHAVLRRSPEALLVALIILRVWFGPQIVAFLEVVTHFDAFSPLLVDVVVHMPYMALGAWYAIRRSRVDQAIGWAWPAAILLGVAMLISRETGFWYPPRPYDRLWQFVLISSSILGLVGLALSVGRHGVQRLMPRKHVLQTVACLSYGAYLLHPLVIYWMRVAVGAIGIGAWWNSALFVGAFFGVALATSIGLTALISRAPGIRRLV